MDHKKNNTFKWILLLVITFSGCVFKPEKVSSVVSSDICNCISALDDVSNESIKGCFDLYNEKILNESENTDTDFNELRTSILSDLNETCPKLNAFLQKSSEENFVPNLDTVFHLKPGTYVFDNDTSRSFCITLNESTYRVLENCDREVGRYSYEILSDNTFKLKERWLSDDYKNITKGKRVDFFKICQVNSKLQYLIKEYSNNETDSLSFVLTKVD